MNDDPLTDETPWHFPRTNRVNGFAPGDRVAIVNCELAGAYGKIVDSRGGCTPSTCRDKCRLVFVDLMSRPKDIEVPWYRESFINPKALRFMVSEVVHVD